MVAAMLVCASPSWTADSHLTITLQESHTEAILMGIYLVFSLLISFLVNLVNRRMQLVTR